MMLQGEFTVGLLYVFDAGGLTDAQHLVIVALARHASSPGKDTKALATAVLYAACIKENESKVSQAKIAESGSISVVTLRKRFSDILRIIPRDSNSNNCA
jgi:transcription initiation factor TFIIIB Brf1 subunit/transcription initiation factor TFIIB